MFFYMYFFSSCFIVLIQNGLCGCLQAGTKRCRLNLNCDLAVANCESAAELPIKPFSSSCSRFLFFGWFISLILSVLVFVISKVQISLLLSYLMFLDIF